ncbi:MAG: glycosyltransferase family 4 protein [Cytophaga sp.]|uniref:glycosyltransferase family 4 protein n=1 Tax=Cytophaga sp. TaxID=29535 RepID=UPI003F7F2257
MYVSESDLNVMPKVICVHIGARAHYLIPKAFMKTGILHTLITDTWIKNPIIRFLLGSFPVNMLKSLAGRYSSSIPSAHVKALGLSFLIEEYKIRKKYPQYGWKQIIARDVYFKHAAGEIQKKCNGATAVFGISYTSLTAFKIAKEQKLKTILYQMDPGKGEEDIVADIIKQNGTETSWQPAPDSYWQQWKEECMLADSIMVNSEWSRRQLQAYGIDGNKIVTIPLPYEITNEHVAFNRTYPDIFTRQRPLRCLFLGTLTLRKGIHLVLEAAEKLKDQPIEFIIAGRNELSHAQLHTANVIYKGVLTRAETDRYYQQADVFLFPTLSDGFGLTQLEALAWKLPVIATDRCGEVVQDKNNGWVMQTPSANELIQILLHILSNPSELNKASSNTLKSIEKYSIDHFASSLYKLV